MPASKQLSGNTVSWLIPRAGYCPFQALLHDLQVPEPMRRTLLVLAGLPLWRLAIWPVSQLLEGAGIGPVMTIVARKV